MHAPEELGGCSRRKEKGISIMRLFFSSLVACGTLFATVGVGPAQAAPGQPGRPPVVSVPAIPVLPTPTPNPLLHIPVGSDPPPRLPTPPRIAAVNDDYRHQVLAFAIDGNGELKTVVKDADPTLDPNIGEPDGFWGAAFNLSTGMFPAGAPIASVYQPAARQIDVFAVDTTGALQDVRRISLGNGPAFWQPPAALTGPGFAPPGAPLAAIFQPLNEQVEVYVVDNNGALKGVWNEHNGAWKPAFNLTGDGFAPRYAELSAVWEPDDELLEVFAVDKQGSIKGVWKLHDREWQSPETVAGPGFASPGAPSAASWDPTNKVLHVFSVDGSGNARVISRSHVNGVPLVLVPWPGARPIFTGIGLPANAPMSVGWSATRESPVAWVVDTDGAVHQTYRFRGEWQGAYTPVTGSGFAPAGAPPATNGSTVFAVDPTKAMRMVGNWNNAPLTGPNYAPIYGTHTAWCMGELHPLTLSQTALKDCEDFLGITQHCAAEQGHVVFGYKRQSEIPFLTCGKNAPDQGIIEQYEEIAKAVESAVVTVFVGIAPMLGPAVEASACASGVIFACATLAVDVAAQVAGAEGVASDVLDLSNAAASCADGDILACVKLGTKGASVSGVDIPGEDLARAGQDGQACADGDFAACLRLGEQAAGAAGIKVDVAKQAAQEADACLDGDFGACTSLGQHAAQLGVPIGGVANAGDNLNACQMGDVVACTQLGQALAAVPG
jgi:hypothetical protein